MKKIIFESDERAIVKLYKKGNTIRQISDRIAQKLIDHFYRNCHVALNRKAKTANKFIARGK